MIDKFVPDKYFKSIYDINYKLLKTSGVKCLVFDIANTLMPESSTKPNKKVKDLFEDLKDMGFKIILIILKRMLNHLKKNCVWIQLIFHLNHLNLNTKKLLSYLILKIQKLLA